MNPFQRFLDAENAGGIVLLSAAVLALAWANSPWAERYELLWQAEIEIRLGKLGLAKPLRLWINDALMAAFFFVIGLEIKREILVGELASPRQAALPIAAALGGMIVPAAVYLTFNAGDPQARGWGIPMATDIAFALGVLALLGDRVPLTAKVFLTALAIVDDIGASLVIALFYSEDISQLALGIGALFWLGQIALNVLGVRRALFYALLGLGLWLSFLESGVHPTIAGVLGALTIPTHRRVDGRDFVDSGRELLDEFERAGECGDRILTNAQQQGAVDALETITAQVQTPLQRLEEGLHPWVTFFIMPVFAFANAGVSLTGGINFLNPVALGIGAGLIVGKQVGIIGFSWLATRGNLLQLPSDLTWRHIYGLGWIAGIGFTMSLFIAGLAFGEGSATMPLAKLSILLASFLSGIGGWLILRGANNQ